MTTSFRRSQKRKSAKAFMNFNQVMKPNPKLAVAEFAEAYRQNSLTESEKPGAWKNWPFQIEMQNAFVEEGAQKCSYMTSAQVSKTAQELNITAYIILNRTGGISFMLPTKTLATEYSQVRFNGMVDECKALRKILPKKGTRGNKVLFKNWGSGYLRFIGSENSNDLCSFPSKYVIIDELDRCSLVARNSKGEIEGNTLKLLLKRMTRFREKFLLMASTPTTVETSLIYEHFKRSDQRHFHISCPKCSDDIALEWDNFDWKGRDKSGVLGEIEDLIESFYYKCPKCSDTFTDDELPLKPEKLNGKWVKMNPNGEHPGFHINQFYTNDWKELFQEYLECGQNQIKLMSFWNTVLGLPYSFEAIAVPEWEELKKRSVNYERGVVPSPACLLLGGSDVQHSRIECVIVGVNRHRIWVVEHAIFNCEQGDNTANRDSVVWKNFRDFRHKSFPTESGHSLSPLAVAIDSRHRKDVVIREAKEDPSLIPVTGSPSVWDRDILPAQRGEINMGTATNRIWKAIDIQRYPLGVNLLKMDLYGRLNMSRTPAEVRNDDYPKEWIEFPTGLPSEFYKQLCGEVLEVNEDSRGKTKRNWRPDYENVEILDCMTYILGLFKIKNLHDWSDERWQLEEAEIGLGGPIEEKTSGPIVGKMF